MNAQKWTLLVGLLLFSLFLNAQRSTEGGIFLGVAYYQGDLAPSPIAASEARPAVGGIYRFLFGEHFALKGSATWAKLSGKDDNRPSFVAGERNWTMRSTILELGVHPEWHFFASDRYGTTGLYSRKYSPFISVGLGAAFTKINLDVPTEDRFKIPESKAKSTFLVIPITAGVRFDITEDWLIAAEFGTRCTFSDYIDGVSLNGNSKKDDWYFFTGISVVYLIQEIVGSKIGN